MDKEDIVYLPVKDLVPYKNNPRKNADAVDAVMASIREFGFRSPIIITEGHEVINGHTRLKAAKKLGMKEVPCLIAYGLTEEQIRQYRLIDNKTSEYASWDSDLLSQELDGLNLDIGFEFDFSGDLVKQNPWAETQKRCDLKDKIALHNASGVYYHSMFKAGKEGKLLADIKTEDNVGFFAAMACKYIRATIGEFLRDGGWCVITTPRRRHAEGFQFATEISRKITAEFEIPFYEGGIVCFSRTRVNPTFELVRPPAERNVILYDDITTTGQTIKFSREVLQGYNVFALVSIEN